MYNELKICAVGVEGIFCKYGWLRQPSLTADYCVNCPCGIY